MKQGQLKVTATLFCVYLFLFSCDTGTSPKGGDTGYRLVASSYTYTRDSQTYTKETVYEYSSDDELQRTTYYLDGTILEYVISEYDDSGFLIKSSAYMFDDSLFGYTLYSDFTAYGDAQCIRTFTNTDVLDSESEYAYTYDELGRKISESKVGAELNDEVLNFLNDPTFETLVSESFYYVQLFSTLFTYEYDEFDNCVVQRYYCVDEQHLIYTLILQNEYDVNGNLMKVTGSNGYVWQYEWEAY